MKDNGNKNIPICLVIKPVHDNNKRNNANDKVKAVYPPFEHNIGMIVPLDSC